MYKTASKHLQRRYYHDAPTKLPLNAESWETSIIATAFIAAAKKKFEGNNGDG